MAGRKLPRLRDNFVTHFVAQLPKMALEGGLPGGVPSLIMDTLACIALGAGFFWPLPSTETYRCIRNRALGLSRERAANGRSTGGEPGYAGAIGGAVSSDSEKDSAVMNRPHGLHSKVCTLACPSKFRTTRENCRVLPQPGQGHTSWRMTLLDTAAPLPRS
jgi:hypothetical protein